MILTSVQRDQLHQMQHHQTPFFRHPRCPQLYIKHEGLGLYPAHKFRSAAWLAQHVADQGIDPCRAADRSSGSWAMGLAKVAHTLGGESVFVTVNNPTPTVRSTVEALGGRFKLVHSNPERIVAVERYRSMGWWCPDQHDCPVLIEAFEQTLGKQLADDLNAHGVNPAFLVAARGTGASLAGVAKALKGRGFSIQVIAADLNSGITHAGTRGWKPTQVSVRGVSSDDELCGTFRATQPFIDDEFQPNALQAAEEMRQFHQDSVGCGASGGLTLAVATRIMERHPNAEVVVILADHPLLYANELGAANQMFSKEMN